jgi:FkbM family methyltransferase
MPLGLRCPAARPLVVSTIRSAHPGYGEDPILSEFSDDDLVGLDDGAIHRVRMTASCSDAANMPKVPGAGEVFEQDGVLLQRMHNGLLIEQDSYYGPMMTAIIRRLHGHHEPQEEVVIDAIIRRLNSEETSDQNQSVSVIEFGSHWSFYSLWFCSAVERARAVAMEPDPAYLDVGRRHAARNGLEDRIEFIRGAIGDSPGQDMQFLAESDGQTYSVPTYDLHSLMERSGLDRADVVLADVQGAERILLDRAASDFAEGAVRFLVVSTHHHLISADPIIHQRALAQLTAAGAHVIAEHTVGESYSGDGLIAVSFDARDAGFTVDVSHARYKESLFGELEYHLEAAHRRASAAEGDAAHAHRHIAALEQQIAQLKAELTRAAAVGEPRPENPRGHMLRRLRSLVSSHR